MPYRSQGSRAADVSIGVHAAHSGRVVHLGAPCARLGRRRSGQSQRASGQRRGRRMDASFSARSDRRNRPADVERVAGEHADEQRFKRLRRAEAPCGGCSSAICMKAADLRAAGEEVTNASEQEFDPRINAFVNLTVAEQFGQPSPE